MSTRPLPLLVTVGVCALLAAGLTVLSVGLPRSDAEVAGSATSTAPSRPPPQGGVTAAAEPGSEPALRAHLQLSRRLHAGGVTPLRVYLLSHDLDPDDRVEVQVELRLRIGLRGQVWAMPPRTVVRAGDLHLTSFGIGSVADVPCDEFLGRVRVRLRPLEGDVSKELPWVSLPERACDAQDPPAAPGSIHLDEVPVCGDQWDRHEELREDGRRPPSAPCRPVPRSRAPENDEEASEDVDEETDESDAEDDEAGDSDDEDEDEEDDDDDDDDEGDEADEGENENDEEDDDE